MEERKDAEREGEMCATNTKKALIRQVICKHTVCTRHH